MTATKLFQKRESIESLSIKFAEEVRALGHAENELINAARFLIEQVIDKQASQENQPNLTLIKPKSS